MNAHRPSALPVEGSRSGWAGYGTKLKTAWDTARARRGGGRRLLLPFLHRADKLRSAPPLDIRLAPQTWRERRGSFLRNQRVHRLPRRFGPRLRAKAVSVETLLPHLSTECAGDANHRRNRDRRRQNF